ncbi:MAG: cysteine-rich CWC family protein [Flavobacteriales bacterium]|nr:cysteine-rich CWC family protein [Flavobacteriales bacterium]
MMKEEWKRSRCSNCGKGFLCGVELTNEECWCHQLPHIIQLPEQESKGCYCPDCLKELIDSQEGKAD